MAQISRLHSTEIANGNLIDATHINNELNQLVSESNSQDTRLTTAESSITSHISSLKNVIYGLMVDYSTANRVIIRSGHCRDSGNTEFMEVTANITVDIATAGANGLDTGSEAASTWYYLWLIKNTSNGTVAGLFSTSSTSPTMPTGYTKKRLLPIAVRNDGSSNLLPFYVAHGWPQLPMICYNVAFTDTGTAGTTQAFADSTSGSFTAKSLANYVPPVSKTVLMVFSVSSGTANPYIRATGDTHNGQFILSGAGSLWGIDTLIKTNASQSIDVKRASGTLYGDVKGFAVDTLP